jgi:flagellar basal-body rod modification protein FlgD
MSSITSPITSSSSVAAAASKAVSSTSASGGVANESTFLTLLVAQLKNQDPMSPADSTQFVTQLAQFSSLEALTNINTNVGAIEQVVAPAAAAGTSSSGSSSSGNTSNSNISALLG